MAASMMDHRWITQPNKMIHNRMDMTNMNPARIHRPCNNCPRPGMKKLHKAAITFPDEPRPIIFSFRACAIDKLVYAEFVPSSTGVRKSMLKCLCIRLCGVFCLSNKYHTQANSGCRKPSDHKKWRIPPTESPN